MAKTQQKSSPNDKSELKKAEKKLAKSQAELQGKLDEARTNVQKVEQKLARVQAKLQKRRDRVADLESRLFALNGQNEKSETTASEDSKNAASASDGTNATSTVETDTATSASLLSNDPIETVLYDSFQPAAGRTDSQESNAEKGAASEEGSTGSNTPQADAEAITALHQDSPPPVEGPDDLSATASVGSATAATEAVGAPVTTSPIQPYAEEKPEALTTTQPPSPASTSSTSATESSVGTGETNADAKATSDAVVQQAQTKPKETANPDNATAATETASATETGATAQESESTKETSTTKTEETENTTEADDTEDTESKDSTTSPRRSTRRRNTRSTRTESAE